jgi:YXWGXW repeat-containing protein
MVDRGFGLGATGGVLLLSLVLCQGCVAAVTTPPARAIIVAGPPPAPLVEERTPSTQPLAVWIAGYWHWTGIQYAWIPGHWEVAPPSGATWRAPRYTKMEGAYVYEPGTWWTAPEASAQRANAFH